jgi:plasmid maintenance system antidote protein VapI
VGDVKSRQELAADLFNDTFEELKITRTAEQMPKEAIPIEVPEIRELLIQLSILTHLSPTELDEFNADISKMKMSEQAAFVREVIAQEAIRAARASGKTVDEILEETASESTRLISESEEVTEIIPGLEEPVEERVFLPEDDVVTPEPDTTVETPTVEEKAPTDKLSKFELDELQAELVRKGVPNHEISMIIEQAQDLSRELVDELMRSLGLKE